MNPVPETYLGVWQRTLLTTTAGKRDTSTRVYWLQTSRLFADLRIPLPAPASATERAAQAGFSGVTEIVGDRCQWHRLIDFRPATGEDDIGLMRFENSEYLLEDGLDGSYHEVWERLPESVGRNWGSWLRSADGRQGCLLLAGDCFLFAAGLPRTAPAGADLAELAAQDPGWLDFELSFGRHHGGLTPWRIELSTLPARIGAALLPAEADPDRPAELLGAAGLARLGAQPPAGGWKVAPDPMS
ncbi:hypothetical protein PKB_2169 [Pseudomonas knackmussii B13]|uniref:Uncharacterized protein n=1 Tax=Pseudomonas knackmussii (strain DSM 6978 / CCUG 54928 / LMG 23759 / B13) TaxID=1301098 RepID=A0A024HF58_PSEKB|nr:hypothetical protein [Pseudomonas knackmussii]CDF83516.1 hypothetical protein PKB_2169 [Pseudomonas knackmussii B13]